MEYLSYNNNIKFHSSLYIRWIFCNITPFGLTRENSTEIINEIKILLIVLYLINKVKRNQIYALDT